MMGRARVVATGSVLALARAQVQVFATVLVQLRMRELCSVSGSALGLPSARRSPRNTRPHSRGCSFRLRCSTGRRQWLDRRHCPALCSSHCKHSASATASQHCRALDPDWRSCLSCPRRQHPCPPIHRRRQQARLAAPRGLAQGAAPSGWMTRQATRLTLGLTSSRQVTASEER